MLYDIAFCSVVFYVKTNYSNLGTFCKECAQDDQNYAGYYDYGSEDYNEDDYLDYEIDEIHDYPRFDGVGNSDDLAIIRTRSKIFLDYKIVPICLTDEFMDTSHVFHQFSGCKVLPIICGNGEN